jgi:hypothetical protein
VGVVLQMVSETTLAVARTGQCAGIVCMARVGLGWDTRHNIWVCTRRMVVRSWTDKDVGFFEGGVNVTPDSIWMAHERRCACLMPHC